MVTSYWQALLLPIPSYFMCRSHLWVQAEAIGSATIFFLVSLMPAGSVITFLWLDVSSILLQVCSQVCSFQGKSKGKFFNDICSSFCLGHLPRKIADYEKRHRSLASTYVTFSPDGGDLLVNLGGEQIYLFNLYNRQRPSFVEFPPAFLSAHQNGVCKGQPIEQGLSLCWLFLTF